MAGVAAYLYTSDEGITYQIVLPSDFAVALGYTPATGVEPYIPASLSPRYATYQVSIPPLWRQVVIPTQAQFTNPPSSVSADGFIWSLKNLIGETTTPLQGGNFMLASGPQGPQGDTGPQGPQGPAGFNTYYTYLISGDVAVAANNAGIVCTSGSLGAGTYFATCIVNCLMGAAAGFLTAQLSQNSGIISPTVFAFSQSGTASSWQNLQTSGVFTVTSAPATVVFSVFTTVAMTIKSTTQQTGSSRANMTIFQLA